MLRRRARAIAVLLAASLLSPGVALAQPEPQAGESASPEDKKGEAAARFYKGRKLYQEGAFSAALAEFQASRELYPNQGATIGAAESLKRLQRFDEALDLFEVVLRDFSETLEAARRDAIQREVIALRGLVGTVEIEQAEPGATITVDGQRRGEFPLLAPLRVAAGSHGVRVYKEGFEPFETRVEVAGGKTARVAARLARLKQIGTLRVVEARGRELSVVVDDIEVGKTSEAPLSVPLAPGAHVVLLRGAGRLGTAPVRVSLRVDEVALVRLEAEELDAALRIAPVPVDALVSLDGVSLGRGPWQGQVRTGKHIVEVTAEGFLPGTQAIVLARDGRAALSVELERDPGSPFWRKPPPPPRFLVELGTALLIAPSFGGDVAGTCGTGCSAGVGAGSYGVLRGGYQLSSGIGFGASFGALSVKQAMRGRRTSLNLVGDPAAQTASEMDAAGAGDTTVAGQVDDVLRLRGLFLGAWVGYALDAGLPIRFRLGAGGVFGSMSDARRGSFTARTAGAEAYSLGTVVGTQAARFVFVTPEVRVAWSLSEHVALNAGLEVPVLFAVSRPAWREADGIRAGPDGYGWFSAETLVGGVVVAVAPTVGVRFDF
ncbi:PEGA domain-containing protein [Sorangium sp. So ce1153]|uniref:PEGA domain-containing protein n=1 Tax=Sorangium sp. So ce1153 TaxID=3133333 RepID=UPI003F5E7F17